MRAKVYLFSISSHPKATSINSLDITFFKPDIDFSSYDYFIITSKQAIESLKQYKNICFKPALCISEQTAKAYRNMGGDVLEVGSGYGDSLGNRIKGYDKSIRWIYLRAEVIASDFVLELGKDNYKIDETILYKSECSKKLNEAKVETNATLIFTSPSSIKCFLKSHVIDSLSKVIVIGETTANALPPNVNYILAKERTIESCLELI